ncbi:MAG: 7-carboxy-7-deazaguanine synthase QueE [Cyclobacteriaceae bacterium]
MTAQSLPLMESFYTIQGEGAFTGHAAYFIRLGGCDVGCVWCDVKESWDAGKHPLRSIVDMTAEASNSGSRIVVITGGEPAMHDLTELTVSLKNADLRTHIETSGAHPLTGDWDWVCLSPKKFKQPLPEVYSKADELKIIVYNRTDLEWAVAEATKVGPGCKYFLQPEWSREKEMLPLIVDFVKQHPEWQISLQTHKYMNIP